MSRKKEEINKHMFIINANSKVCIIFINILFKILIYSFCLCMTKCRINNTK